MLWVPSMTGRLPMITRLWILALALGSACSVAAAQNPRVLLETDRGPLLLELDAERAPNTTTNFLRYVDEGRLDASLIHRVVRDFVIQGGGFLESGQPVAQFAAIASERNNGLLNVPGSIAMALSGNPPNINSATSDFFINTGTNANLDANFTVFGRIVHGMGTLAAINQTPVFAGTEQPIRIPLLRRAVRVAPGEFPILPLHTGTWFDPQNTGKGFLIEVARVDGSESGPLMVVSWYDFHEGRQIWTIGAAPFSWGDSSVEVPMLISSGGQFGADFDPEAVVNDPAWGSLQMRFTGCDSASFSYATRFGSGTMPVRSLTLPTGEACAGN